MLSKQLQGDSKRIVMLIMLNVFFKKLMSSPPSPPPPPLLPQIKELEAPRVPWAGRLKTKHLYPVQPRALHHLRLTFPHQYFYPRSRTRTGLWSSLKRSYSCVGTWLSTQNFIGHHPLAGLKNWGLYYFKAFYLMQEQRKILGIIPCEFHCIVSESESV